MKVDVFLQKMALKYCHNVYTNYLWKLLTPIIHVDLWIAASLLILLCIIIICLVKYNDSENFCTVVILLKQAASWNIDIFSNAMW